MQPGPLDRDGVVQAGRGVVQPLHQDIAALGEIAEQAVAGGSKTLVNGADPGHQRIGHLCRCGSQPVLHLFCGARQVSDHGRAVGGDLVGHALSGLVKGGGDLPAPTGQRFGHPRAGFPDIAGDALAHTVEIAGELLVRVADRGPYAIRIDQDCVALA